MILEILALKKFSLVGIAQEIYKKIAKKYGQKNASQVFDRAQAGDRAQDPGRLAERNLRLADTEFFFYHSFLFEL